VYNIVEVRGKMKFFTWLLKHSTQKEFFTQVEETRALLLQNNFFHDSLFLFPCFFLIWYKRNISLGTWEHVKMGEAPLA